MERLGATGCRACWKCPCTTGLPLEVHHLLDCGRRRGHDFTISLCSWHHRGILIGGKTTEFMEETWGPSVAHGTRLFKDRFGTDDELLAEQNKILEGK